MAKRKRTKRTNNSWQNTVIQKTKRVSNTHTPTKNNKKQDEFGFSCSLSTSCITTDTLLLTRVNTPVIKVMKDKRSNNLLRSVVGDPLQGKHVPSSSFLCGNLNIRPYTHHYPILYVHEIVLIDWYRQLL